MFKRIYFIQILMCLAVFLAACAPSAAATPEPPLVAISTIPANTASISGNVWHDLCALAGGEGGSPVQPSAGCVASADGGFKANGTRETGEPGLEGILVSLGYGACGNVTDHLETRTDQDGTYEFANLPAGAYCVMIDPLRAENALLLPGGWTSPVASADTSVISISANLMSSEQKAGLDFGWDYQFLPLPSESEAVQPATSGKVNVEALNLRAGPSLNHRIFLQLKEGTLLEITGRSENQEWLLVRLESGTQGWVYSGYVDTQAVLADLPMLEAYGGAYLNPVDVSPPATSQGTPLSQNIVVSIEGNVATVNIAGFVENAKLIVILESPDGKADLVVGSGKSNANGNAAIQFEMPREWADGEPLTSGDLVLIVSSKDGKARISADIQYYR